MPSKACFHLWLVQVGKVLTHDNLMKRGLQMVSQCSMCKRSIESAPHLFLHCPVAVELCREFLLRFRQSWAVPESTQVFLQAWYGVKDGYMSPRGFILWKCIPHVVFWCIWVERNARIFEGKEVLIKILERTLGLLI